MLTSSYGSIRKKLFSHYNDNALPQVEGSAHFANIVQQSRHLQVGVGTPLPLDSLQDTQRMNLFTGLQTRKKLHLLAR